jgi:glyoxylase-like metal-dependent hydrolase (beta-lactamase superfamily II)
VADFFRLNRRVFLAHLGKGTLAMAVFAACENSAEIPSTSAGGTSPSTTPATTAGTTNPGTSAAPASTAAPGARFERVNLGFVSAYIVARGSEAAIVDTGVSGSESGIEAALGEVGLGWEHVGHVILTHRHPDHVGSAPAVLEAASGATGYAGEGDLASITSPRALTPLADGSTVFGLDVVGTPGHTAGHICLLDSSAGVLVAGDALVGAEGGVVGPNPQFSSDHDEALRSVEKLASLAYEHILFGHGEPVSSGGSTLVADLAAGL